MKRRSLLAPVVPVFLIVSLLAGCVSMPEPTRPSNPRTTVPTWTLPFGPSETPGALLETQAPVVSTPDPAETSVPGTVTPTARPGIDPTLGAVGPDPSAELVTPIPEPMPQLFLDEGVYNILLLGRDTSRDSGTYRTDVMIVVSINKTANAVTMLTLPRDLFVYIPGWTMNRLNTAAAHGDAIGYPGGGVALLEQTILYNFGIPIHGWARIDFDGFKQVVNVLGGVEVPVSCPMQDWRLRDTALDPQDADNWELYTVPVGLVEMDGDYALWYARSRKRSSDFDRSRRQHQVLRALFEKGLQLGMLPKAPELYAQYVQIVDTDLGIGDILQFVPMAAQIDPSRIKSRFVGRDQVWSWTTPGGAAVLLPDRGAISALLQEAFLPPPGNSLSRSGPAVEVWNGTRFNDYTALAVDNLQWSGVTPVVGQSDRTDYANTVLYDYTTSPKGSIRAELQQIFRIPDERVIAQPDAAATSPYRVILGADYDPCLKPSTSIVRPTPTPGPGQAPVAGGPSGPLTGLVRVTEQTPQINGDLSEWPALVYPASRVGFGADNWTGAADASASWNVVWDDARLYFAVRVQDDVFVQQSGGEALFRGDSVEIWLSTGPGERQATLSGREYQIGVSPGDLAGGTSGPDAFFWLPQQFRRPVGQEVGIAARRTETGYNLEFTIPWSLVGTTPTVGREFALILALDDDDTPGTGDQESQITSIAGAQLANPLTWNNLVILEDATP
ncbi:MAG: LCP family protein [Anaerolineales bacterium]|nr:LCP family protein [Anaerolineales bacterium]